MVSSSLGREEFRKEEKNVKGLVAKRGGLREEDLGSVVYLGSLRKPRPHLPKLDHVDLRRGKNGRKEKKDTRPQEGKKDQ